LAFGGAGENTVCKFIKFIHHLKSIIHVSELISKLKTSQFRLKLSGEETFDLWCCVVDALLNVHLWKRSINVSLSIIDTLEELNELSFGKAVLALRDVAQSWRSSTQLRR